MNNSMKWLAALLFISLAANVYYIGGYIGHNTSALHHKIKKPKSLHDSRFSMRQLTRGLPKDIRKQIGDAIKGERESLHEIMAKQQELRTQTITLLKAERVDVEALRDIFKQQRILTGEIQAPAHEALLKILPTVDQQTRQDMVKKMRNSMREERKLRKERKHGRNKNKEEKTTSGK